jgi:tRNA(Phe) wybutosine-synthesizing methylase Tyw3
MTAEGERVAVEARSQNRHPERSQQWYASCSCSGRLAVLREYAFGRVTDILCGDGGPPARGA